jgi:hypothetical protein
MARDIFLEELEKRLEENRKLAAGSWLPRPLWGLASYMAFHTFRTLLLAALGITVLGTIFGFRQMLDVGKAMFLYGQ